MEVSPTKSGLSGSRRRRSRTIQENQSDDDGAMSDEAPISVSTRQFGVSNDDSGARTEGIEEVREGYEFILSAIGGEPSEKAVKRLLKSIGAPKSLWLLTNDIPEAEEEADVHADANLADGDQLNGPEKSRGDNDHVARSLGFDEHESPVMDEELAIVNDGGDNMNDMFTRDGDGADGIGGSVMSGRRRRPSDGRDDAFAKLKKPVRPIRLTGVVPVEMVRPSHADSLNVVTGNESDDKACQGEMGMDEWILGAEHLIGLSGGDDSGDGVELLTTTTTRKIWSSMFEARVFERMGTAGSMNESHVVILCGICLRLLSSAEFQPDMAGRLLRELLKLRDRQMQAAKSGNMDSLLMVLTSTTNAPTGVGGHVTVSPDAVPLRHRAIATVWAALLTLLRKAAAGQIAGGVVDININKILSDAFDESIDAVFVAATSTDRSVRAATEGKIAALIDALRLVSFAFALRLDVFEEDGDGDGGNGIGNYFGNEGENEADLFNDMERMVKNMGDDAGMSNDDARVEPDEDLVPCIWPVVCTMFNRFSSEAKTLAGMNKIKSTLGTLLANVAHKLCARHTWVVDDSVVACIAKAVHTAATVAPMSSTTSTGRGDVSKGLWICSQDQVGVFLARISQLCDEDPEDADDQATLSLLKTPCDYLIYIGRLYVTRGSGNAMKRAMNVIRHNAALTSNTAASSGPYSICAVRHRVALILSIADAISDGFANAGGGKGNVGVPNNGVNTGNAPPNNGESHVLKMLTAKAGDLKTVLRNAGNHRSNKSSSAYGSNTNGNSGFVEDEKWSIVHQAIVARCETIVARTNRFHDHQHLHPLPNSDDILNNSHDLFAPNGTPEDNRNFNPHSHLPSHQSSCAVDTYVHWLCAGVTEGFQLMRRIAERRSSMTADRESLRVQEGILGNVVEKRVNALRDVLSVVWTSVDGGKMDGASMVRCVSAVVQPCVILFGFCRETVAQLRTMPNAAVASTTVTVAGRAASSISGSGSSRTMGSANMKTSGTASTTPVSKFNIKARDQSLVNIMQVLQLMLQLLARVCADAFKDFVQGPVAHFVRRRGLYRAVVNTEHDAVIADLMAADSLVSLTDPAVKTNIKCIAALLSSLLVDVRVRVHDEGWGGTGTASAIVSNTSTSNHPSVQSVSDCEPLVTFVRNLKLDIVNMGRGALITQGATATTRFGMQSQRIDDACMVRFWYWGVRCGWVRDVFERQRDIRPAVLGMVAWAVVSYDSIGVDEVRMIDDMKRALCTWECMDTFGLQAWSQDEVVDSSTGIANNGNRAMTTISGTANVIEQNQYGGKTICMHAVLAYIARDWGRPATRALIAVLRPRVTNMIRTRRMTSASVDGVQMLGLLLRCEADARGFCAGGGARWMQNWLAELCEAIQRQSTSTRFNNQSSAHDKRRWATVCEHVQRCVMATLALVTSDGREAELRMFTLRLINAMPVSDDLRGLWSVRHRDEHDHDTDDIVIRRLLFANGPPVSDDMRRRAKRNIDAWKTYLFRSVVDHPLVSALKAKQRTVSAAANSALDGGPIGVAGGNINNVHAASANPSSGGGSMPFSICVRRFAAAVDAALQCAFDPADAQQLPQRDDAVLVLARTLVNTVRSNGMERIVTGDGASSMTWRRVCGRLGLVSGGEGV